MTTMNLEEIKQAVEAGHTVHWASEGYVVIRDEIGQWLIRCLPNGHCIGLTRRDGVTMNGKPEDFFVAPLRKLGQTKFQKLLVLQAPVNGAYFVGPFADIEECFKYAGQHEDVARAGWSVVSIASPSELFK
jgi:hypothetical protein